MEKTIALLKRLGAKDDEIELAQAEFDEGIESNVEGLKTKNRELLGKLKKATNGDGEKVGELEAQIESLSEKLQLTEKAAKKSEELRLRSEKELTDKYNGEQKANHALLVEAGLADGLSKIGIKPEHIPAVKALLAQRVSVEAEGETRKAIAVFKDKDGKESKVSLGEYLEKHWSSSDEGKAFIPANQNGGAGFSSSNNSNNGKVLTRSQFDASDAQTKFEFVKSGGKVVEG